MGKSFHRKHYDKYNYYDDEDFGKFKKRRKHNDRRHVRQKVLTDKHANINVRFGSENEEETVT